MKKILIFHPVIAPYRIDFFNSLYSNFDVKICLFKRNLSSQKFDYEKIEKQFEFTPFYIERRLGFFHWIKQIIAQLSTPGIDVVLLSELGIATLIAIIYKYLTFKRYKIVSMIDDSYNMIVENNQFSKKHKYATKMLVPLLDEVINVEPRVTEYYQQRYKKGFFFPIITNEEISKQRLKRVLPISNKYIVTYNLYGKNVLLFVGRLVKLKNVMFAVKAFLKANIPNSIFVIVGDGPERKNLEQFVKKYKNIAFTGRLEGDDLYAWYNIAQCFTLPSIQEPFGAVTNEALQGGCKVLISKLAGSSCLVSDGENGYVIDPEDMGAYVEKLHLVFDKAEVCKQICDLRTSLMNYSFENQMSLLCKRIAEL